MTNYQIKEHIVDHIKEIIDNSSEEVIRLIKEYNNQFLEDKISSKIYNILNNIQNKVTQEYLKEFFISEEIFFSSAAGTRYFYTKDEVIEKIRTNLELNLNWFAYRERKIGNNYLFRARYCWIIWCLNNNLTKYISKCVRCCRYTLVIYFDREWYKREGVENELIGEHLNQSLICYELLEDDEKIKDTLEFAMNLFRELINRRDYRYVLKSIEIINRKFISMDNAIKRQIIEILELIKEETDFRYERRINQLLDEINQ